ncbi:MAG: HupE/UreJ family protein [Alphaproteobacteria bacterium]
MRRAAPIVLGLLGALAPAPARAHLVDLRFGDFYGGAYHLVSGLDYALLLVALSLLAALQPRETGRWVVAAVPLGVVTGSVAAAFVLDRDLSAALAVTGALALVALLVAVGRALPVAILVLLSFVAAAILGFENGLAMTVQTDARLYIGGLVGVSLLVVTLTTAALIQAITWGGWARIAVRALGSWIAAVSLILMALATAGPVAGG